MFFDLPDDHEMLRRTVREFAEGEVAPVAEELDRTKSFPTDIVRKMGELGWMGIPFPEEVGGSGACSRPATLPKAHSKFECSFGTLRAWTSTSPTTTS